jgi:hypothetical protein
MFSEVVFLGPLTDDSLSWVEARFRIRSILASIGLSSTEILGC